MTPQRLACAFACILVAQMGCTTAPPPDVILITLDTTRADRLGVYGYEHPVSPQIDAFAAESVVFERAWSTSSWTLPAHASMLTGKHPTSHGAHNSLDGGDVNLGQAVAGEMFAEVVTSKLSDAETTLAELLSARGYNTAAFAGGPWLAPPFGLMQGYNTIDADVGEFAGRSAAELSDRAIEWLDTVEPGRPLHVLINYFDPHFPYAPPLRFVELARGGAELTPGETPPRTAPPVSEDGGVGFYPYGAWKIPEVYDGEIRFMDYHIGRFLDALRAKGRYRDALVILVGDHGELFGEHGQTGHGRWLYEPLMRVPLVVRFPGGRDGGRKTTEPVSVVDIAAIVAGITGIRLPESSEAQEIGKRSIVVAEWFRDRFSINRIGESVNRDLVAAVRWPWKVIKSSSGSTEFYNLGEDPGETRKRETGDVPPELDTELRAALAGFKAPANPEAAGRVDPAIGERLRSLGYTE